jgi:hypothetical protein
VFIALTGTPFIGILLSAAVTAAHPQQCRDHGHRPGPRNERFDPLESALYIILGANIGTCASS